MKQFFGKLGIVLLLVLFLGGCSLSAGDAEPTDAAAAQAILPANSVGPLPPALVETTPLPGSEIAAAGKITFYFNQPMDKPSVESSIQASPALNGSFRWLDDATMEFSPAQPWPENAALSLTLGASVKSADGLTMDAPVSLDYTTADYLRLTQALPEGATQEIDPASAIVASFNRPVVALGPNSTDLPAAFSLEPAAQGHGEWLNTSTYIFYPEPALTGGQTYSVKVNPDLRSTDGNPLETADSWTFSTLQPGFTNFSPALDALHVPLDEPVVVEFNQGMDMSSVEQAFAMVDDQNQPVAGVFSWSEDQSIMTFTPNELYRRGVRYTFEVPARVLSQGGTPLPTGLTRGFYAAMEPFVLNSTPADSGIKETYSPVQIQFNVPLANQDARDYIRVTPELRLNTQINGDTITVFGNFEAEKEYIITVSKGIRDIWGGVSNFDYTFSFTGAPLSATFMPALYQGRGAVVVSAGQPVVSAQVVNIGQVIVQAGRVSLDEFLYQQHVALYDETQRFTPAEVIRNTVQLETPRNRSEVVAIPLNGSRSLSPGIYWLRMEPAPIPDYAQPTVAFAVVTNVQMVFKAGPTDALVWAIDRRTNNPVVDTPVRIVSATGEVLAEGRTDASGIFQAETALPTEVGGTIYALLGEPGGEFFSLAKNIWDQGISPWEFGYPVDQLPPHTAYYLYTDRPIYRPGQTVSYRVIAREAFDGRYQLPEAASVTVTVQDDRGQKVASQTLSLNDFGSGSGAYTLPNGAAPGYYQLVVEEEYFTGTITFQVAEYRKPEIDLSVNMAQSEMLAGNTLNGEIAADYFFDAPASDVGLEWNVYVRDSYFSLPGYKVGPTDLYVSPLANYGSGELGKWVSGGSDTTGSDGRFAFTFPTEAANRTQVYTVETVLRDESGNPVANREEVTLHPEEVYFGLRSDTWLGQVDTETVFDVVAVDWNGQSAGVRDLTVSFGEVTWVQGPDSQYGFPSFEKEVRVLTEASFQTNSEGKIRLPFTPAEPGVYQLEVRSGNALSQLLFWVGGEGSPVWPRFDSNQIELVTDRDSYGPDEIASIFIPNPFIGPALALVTYERGTVMDYQILQVAEAGFSLPVQLTEDSVPNMFVSVTLIGPESFGKLGFRYGLVNLPVDRSAKVLNVEVVGEPQRTAPGEPVTFTIRVTDAAGQPVQGEFSLSVVDKAVLALADPFEENIVDAYYGEQGLAVRTGISMSADADIYLELPGGLGGGGGGDLAPGAIRSNFQDTALWSASVVTAADGTATVEALLPDNLTTWRVLARGLTADTLVGEAVSEIVTTKPLLVRPVLPRFAVIGDELELAAVIQNTTANPISVNLAMKVSGFTLDAQANALQTIEVPANGRVRVGWWGTVENTDQIEVTIAAEGGGYSDATTAEDGGIPVHAYQAPQAYVTAGVLDEGGERLELVSLPRSFTPTGGTLRLEMASSLGGVALEGLEVIAGYETETTEFTVSRFLPNLEMYRAIQDFGLEEATLRARLEKDLISSIRKLESQQNFDGGWSWYSGAFNQSNPAVSAYVLLGLTRASEAGYSVNPYVMDNVVRYLTESLSFNLPTPENAWAYDQSALIHYALSEAGSPVYDLAGDLLDTPDRLSPWAKALLGLTLADSPLSSRVDTLFSDLQSTAVRSASGAHWDTQTGYWQTLSSDVVNNAIVIYALAQHDPASPLVTDAVRYLMGFRDVEGGWGSSYATSWALLAVTEVMRGTAELGGTFAFSASLNDNPFAVGEAGGVEQFSQVVAETPLQSLLTDLPNALKITREPGTGRLYYRAWLNLAQPAESVSPLNRGVGLSRVYYPADVDCTAQDCKPVSSAAVGDLLTVRVTINLPHDVHYLQVEDYIPAGTEVLDVNLNTSQLGEVQQEQQYDPQDPLADGWGWWYFGQPKIYDNRITWLGESLPAGTYELTYTLVVLQPGVFQVIPAQAHQVYFPEVQGVSAGSVFEVTP